MTVPPTGQARPVSASLPGLQMGWDLLVSGAVPTGPVGRLLCPPRGGQGGHRGDRWTLGSDKVGTGTRWALGEQVRIYRAWLTRGLSRCLEGPRPTDAKRHRGLSSEDPQHPDGCRTAHCQKPWPGPRGCVWQKPSEG